MEGMKDVPSIASDEDLRHLPHNVQNTIEEYTALVEMSADRENHPYLAADLRQARLMREAYAWRSAAEQMAQKESDYQAEIARLKALAEERRLKSVEEESHADGNAGSA